MIGLFLLPLFAIVVSALPWTLIALFMWLSPNPPQPEITYGEFPFEVVYEAGNEVITVQDTYVCEYEGVDMNEGVGKYRVWKGYVKSTEESAVILDQKDDKIMYFTVGTPEYYMDDLDEYKITSDFPDICVVDLSGKGQMINYFSIEEAYEKLNIKVLSWKFSKPIENTYKKNLYYKFCDMLKEAEDKAGDILESLVALFQ